MSRAARVATGPKLDLAAESAKVMNFAKIDHARVTLPAVLLQIPESTGGLHEDFRYACAVADCVLRALGLGMPPVVLSSEFSLAWASNKQVGIEHSFATHAGAPLLIAIILHEAGHVLEGHADDATWYVNQPRGAKHWYESLADTYAAVGVWLLGEPQGSAFLAWLETNPVCGAESDTHPAGSERAQRVRAIFQSLDERGAGMRRKRSNARMAAAGSCDTFQRTSRARPSRLSP